MTKNSESIFWADLRESLKDPARRAEYERSLELVSKAFEMAADDAVTEHPAWNDAGPAVRNRMLAFAERARELVKRH